jgi:hypothetical protein
MTVIGALSSFRELGEMSPHKRAQVHRFTLTGCRHTGEVALARQARITGENSPSHLSLPIISFRLNSLT